MPDLLFWIYLTNLVFLIVDEMDSVYWKEWELFNLPGGLPGFLLIHFPMLFILLIGLVHLYLEQYTDYIISVARAHPTALILKKLYSLSSK